MGSSPQAATAAADAILTTDLIEKQVALEAELGGRTVRIGGMAKGSGMIHPDMATMLGFFSCDAAVPADVWQAMVRRAVQRSFNSITVDGDTSTNDTAPAYAAGEPLAGEHHNALEQGLTTARWLWRCSSWRAPLPVMGDPNWGHVAAAGRAGSPDAVALCSASIS